MDLKDKSKSKWSGFFKSFSFALKGLTVAFTSERNLQFHLLFSILVICCGFFFEIARVEWIIIILLIGGMFTVELLNTAVEKVVDLVTSEFHPLAKQAKDIAAGAVLMYAMIAVIIGIILFAPYLGR
ncbi:diacylglycerol kinase family protein [Ferdinandcohnia sp. Marseille-Q9671]